MPHKFNADCRDKIPKQKQWVTNWSEYNEGLRRRGYLTVGFMTTSILRYLSDILSTQRKHLWQEQHDIGKCYQYCDDQKIDQHKPKYPAKDRCQ